MCGWVLVIMRVWRLDQMTHRLAWALGMAVSFVTLLWAIESSFAPVHWQRDGSLSVLMGCLASILASWCWVRKSKEDPAKPL